MKIFAKIEFSVCPNSQISNSSIAELVVLLTFWNLNSSCILQSECTWVWFSLSFWKTESGTISSMSMRSSWVLLMTSHISDVWFRSGLKVETTCGWHSVWVMSWNMSWLFWWNVSFLWDQVKNALFKFHFLLVTLFLILFKIIKWKRFNLA